MYTSYDPEADAFHVRFGAPGRSVESQEVAAGIVLDFDADGQVVGVEVLGVRAREGVSPSASVPTKQT